MNKKHTPEPWEAKNLVIGNIAETVYEEMVICRIPDEILSPLGYARWNANARRIVACVNACKNLSDNDLEGLITFGGLTLDRLNVLTAQRDELLAALTHAATDYIDQNGSVPSWWTEKARQMVKDTTKS